MGFGLFVTRPISLAQLEITNPYIAITMSQLFKEKEAVTLRDRQTALQSVNRRKMVGPTHVYHWTRVLIRFLNMQIPFFYISKDR